MERRIQAWSSQLSGLEYVPDEIIVEFGDARSLNSINGSVFLGFEIHRMFQYRPVAVFKIRDGESVAQALARLESIPGVRSVAPNLIRRCSFTPDDILFDRQENLIPIHAPDAWEVTIGSASVDVAIIDTGLDVEHPEFDGRVVWTENFRDGDVIGNQNVFDDSGHGTAVTGIIAAKGNNGIGIAGMAWDVRIMAFRACGGSMLTCSISDEVQALDAAVARGADVINLSLGGKGTIDIESDAIRKAYESGAVIVAAGGNANPGEYFIATGDPKVDLNNLYYPAAFPEVIGVAAMDNKSGSIVEPGQLTRAQFSNYGEAIITVAAVGTTVESTVPYRPIAEVPYAFYGSPNYSRVSGTSFACPQVSGLACLVLSRFSNLGPDEVTSLITQNAFRTSGPDLNHNGVDDYLGYGIIDASATVGAAESGQTVHENTDFLVAFAQSPIFDNEVYVIVRCKRGSDAPPSVSYFMIDTAENEAVPMESMGSHPDTYLGRFHTPASGKVTIQVIGVLDGFPLEPLMFTGRIK
jgi:subtilisin family serine protease